MALMLHLAEGTVSLPSEFKNHGEFLEWFRSGEAPEDLRVGYFNDRFWIQSMPERAFAHNRIKSMITAKLLPLAEEEEAGVYFGDGMTFTSEECNFTCVPDGMFVRHETIASGEAFLRGGRKSAGDTELVGKPDLVIEVVSNSSEFKDDAWLMTWYWEAGVREYWVIDARREPLKFHIHRSGPRGFVSIRKTDGWLTSPILARSFRFVPGKAQFNMPTYTLEIR